MRNTTNAKVWSLFLSFVIACSMLFTLPVAGYAEDGTEDKWTDENTIKIGDAELLHKLFDKLAESENLTGSLKVILTADIKTDKGIKFGTNLEDNELLLDLNGHSITVDSDDFQYYNALSVWGKANVTITGNGSLVSKYAGEYDDPSAVMIYGGNVTIENGTYDAKKPLVAYYSGDDGDKINVVINGGTFTGETPLTVSCADVTVNDGTFTCKKYDSSGWFGDYSPCVSLDGGSTGNKHGNMTIHGGRFENTAAESGAVIESNGNLSIDGGTFIGSGFMNSDSWYSKGDMKYSISGGDFTGAGDFFKFLVEAMPSTVLSVTGGEFTDAQKKEIQESNKLGDADYNKAADLKNYRQEKVPVCEYTGKALRPEIIMNVILSGGEFELGAAKRFSYKTTYKNNAKIGLATVTYTGQGDMKGTAKAVFKIVPKKASFKSVKGSKKALVFKVKSQKGGVKYQIQYKNGKGKWKSKITGKTSLTVKKLKAKKKYKVKVRAFKKVSGKTYYGAWSKTKTVKTK